MTGLLVLPDDVEIVSLAKLPESMRVQLGGERRDYAVTRPRSRVPSKVIDAQAAALLCEFKTPTTLVDAILSFSQTVQRQPTDVLEDAYPFLESCLMARLLVPPGSEAEQIEATLAVGDDVAGYRVTECVQVLVDTELYRVCAPGVEAALKIARPDAGPGIKKILEREARILERLNGRVAPRLLASGATGDGRTYIAAEWISSERCDEAAAVLRTGSPEPFPQALLSLCGKVLDAYATLHSLGIIHADVHLRNLLVEEDGEIRIIDYGLSRVEGDTELDTAPRAGVGFFFDPEYAAAALSQTAPPQSTQAGEQYSVAALIYHLLTGQHYLDFSYEKEVMLRQILEQPPTPLAARGLPRCAKLDDVLLRALSKEAAARFPDMAAMAAAFREAASRSAYSAQATKSGVAPGDLGYASEWLNSLLDRLSDPNIDLTVGGGLFPTASLVYGAAGIACVLLRIASVREDARLCALAARWLDRAAGDNPETGFYRPEMKVTPETVGRVSPYHTPAGIACLEALLAHSTGDLHARGVAVERFLELSHQRCGNLDITNGRSSTLLAMSLLLDAIGWEPASPQKQLVEAGNRLFASLWEQFDRMPAIAESGPDMCLGMAHGWAGYLYVTLRWMNSAHAPAPANLEIRLQQLAEQVRWYESSAWWPFQALPNSPNFGSWCNGSAGYVHLWSLAHRLLREPHWLALAEGAGRDVCHPRDEGYDLCCGLAGKAYSQMHLYNHTGDRLWLEHASAMAMRALREARLADERSGSQIPYSLYRGKIGLAALIADLERPDSSAMPFFESEGWPASPR